MRSKTKILLGYVLLSLFLAYYVNATLFYHSHVIDGVTIAHSHIHPLHHTDKQADNHIHSDDEFIAIQIITSFIATFISVAIFLALILVLLNQAIISITDIAISRFKPGEYLLRAPPTSCCMG